MFWSCEDSLRLGIIANAMSEEVFGDAETKIHISSGFLLTC